ncbi:MAG: cyclic nucleotide-binding domain-containing protein [Deltaproteobacteria bacterium]|nr:cyclic nucleotide-binding domain-containing protein [Deltaproteobacteria bacterium]
MDAREFDELISGNLLFKVLDQEARQKVMLLARVVKYEDEDIIIKQGADSDDIYLLHTGQVHVQTLQEGFIVELDTLEPGTIFGEVAEVSGVPRTATVLAIGEVEAVRFPGKGLVEELRKHPTASKLLDHIVLHRAKDTIEKTYGY